MTPHKALEDAARGCLAAQARYVASDGDWYGEKRAAEQALQCACTPETILSLLEELSTLKARLAAVELAGGAMIGWVAGLNSCFAESEGENWKKFIPMGQSIIQRMARASTPEAKPEADDCIGSKALAEAFARRTPGTVEVCSLCEGKVLWSKCVAEAQGWSGEPDNCPITRPQG